MKLRFFSNRKERVLKKVDIILMGVFPLLAVIVSLILKANFLLSLFLFLVIPALWLSFRADIQKVKKAVVYTTIVFIPLSFISDYLGVVSEAWFIPQTIFPFRLFDIVVIEQLIWGFAFIYFLLIFYEYFFEKKEKYILSPRMKYLVFLLLLLVVFFVILVMFGVLPYLYLWEGILFLLIPLITIVTIFPRLIPKFAEVAAYFFFVTLLYELTALKLNQWVFTGEQFIGWVELFGLRFPFEEFFFWIIISTPALLAIYEFFDDDRK